MAEQPTKNEPALPSPKEGKDSGWQKKEEIAKQARTMGQDLRKGRAILSQPSRATR